MYKRVETWHCSRCDWHLVWIVYYESRCCRLLRCHKRRNESTRRRECQLIPLYAFFVHLGNEYFCIILVRGISRLYCNYLFWIWNMVFRGVGTGKLHIMYLVSNQNMNPKRPSAYSIKSDVGDADLRTYHTFVCRNISVSQNECPNDNMF